MKEGDGTVKVTVVKKVPEPLDVGIRTVDGTAREGEDYMKLEKTLSFLADEVEKVIEIGVIDDDQWEPD